MSEGLIITTGSTGLLGLAVARSLARHPITTHTVVFTVRPPGASGTLDSVLAPSSQPYELHPLEMSCLSSVRAFASTLRSRITSGSLPRIRALICGAAVMQVRGKQTTSDGLEATFQINCLVNFLLVLLLLPVMRDDCRVVFLTSNLIHGAGSSLQGPKVDRYETYAERLGDAVLEEANGSVFAEGTRRYAISKVLLSMFAVEVQERIERRRGDGVGVVLLDPGTFMSGMIKEYPPVLRSVANNVVPLLSRLPETLKRIAKTNFTTATQAANNVRSLALDQPNHIASPGGKSFAWGLQEVPLTPDARNPEARAHLWKTSLELAGLGDGDGDGVLGGF